MRTPGAGHVAELDGLSFPGNKYLGVLFGLEAPIFSAAQRSWRGTWGPEKAKKKTTVDKNTTWGL